MERRDVFEKLKVIFRDLLDNDDLEITRETTMDSLENWDSVLHMTLIAILEDEFSINFSFKEIQELYSINIIEDSVMEKLS